MNVILLIFVILATMFASSSLNNIVSVYGGIDYFFDKADMSDYVIITNNSDRTEEIDILENADAVNSFSREPLILFSVADIMDETGEQYLNSDQLGLLMGISDTRLNYFDRNDKVITDVADGEVYVGGAMAISDDVHIGDTISIDFKGTVLELTIAGYMKDALLGSPFMGNPRLLISDNDMARLLANKSVSDNMTGSIYYIDTDDIKALKSEVSEMDKVIVSIDRDTLELTFMLEMLTAGLMMAVSVCLILIAFAMLSFTIKFTLNEDFREIGVMKAVGLRNRSIRNLYMIKYLCISVIGAVIGFFAGIPFGELLIRNASRSMVIGNDNSFAIRLLSTIGVVLIILGFCYFCTGKIRKMSPIDAVRSGETGERYHRRSVFRLHKSRMRSDSFMAVNDVASKPKQYVSMVITFTTCLLLITMLANTANTLMSDRLLFLLGATKSDVYYSSTEIIMDNMSNPDEDALDNIISDTEQLLADNGMPCSIHIELLYSIPVEIGDVRTTVRMMQCKATHASDYTYNEGVAPQYPNEIAFTPQIMDELGAEIGDKVTLKINDVKSEYIITATFISMNNTGKVGRLHEDVPLRNNDASMGFAFQIDFDDDPSDKVIEERIEKIKELLGTDEVMNVSEFVDYVTNSSSTINSIKQIVLIISLIIAVLITVLMERSFISKERTEIALMKAIGFKTRSICLQHTLRFAVVMIISSILSAILTYPMTKLVIDRIFAVMGAISGIRYKIVPLEVFVMYPLILMAAIIPAAWLTSLYMKTVHSDSMGNIE